MLRTDASVQAFADCMLELVHLLLPEQPVGLVRQLLLRSATDMLQGNGGTITFVRRVRAAHAIQSSFCSEGLCGTIYMMHSRRILVPCLCPPGAQDTA